MDLEDIYFENDRIKYKVNRNIYIFGIIFTFICILVYVYFLELINLRKMIPLGAHAAGGAARDNSSLHS